MTAQTRWGLAAAVVMMLTVAGCAGQGPRSQPTSSGADTASSATVGPVAEPTAEPSATQEPQIVQPAAPVVPGAGTEPGWPIEGACEAGARHLKSVFPYAPPLWGANVVPGDAPNLTCTYGASGGTSAEAMVGELYAGPTQDPDFKKVCTRSASSQQWTAVSYGPTTGNGWLAYDIPVLRDDEIKTAVCGTRFLITVTLTKFPGATDQNALDLAMSMIVHQ